MLFGMCCALLLVETLWLMKSRESLEEKSMVSCQESGSPKAGTGVQNSTSTVCPNPGGVCSD